MKILHLADVHFDSTFRCRSEAVRGLLHESVHGAFRRAVDCAIEEHVDALVVAGDLFDGDLLSFRTERFLVQQTRRLEEAGVLVMIACGNHDPGDRRGRISNIEWPSTVRLLRNAEPEVIEVSGPEGAPKGYIIGAGHETAHEERNLARSFPKRIGSEPTVGVLHTLVTNATDAARHDRYAPCTAEDLARAGYDYWALGHVHTRQQVDDSGKIWYSGSIQGRTPREPGPRGRLLVHLAGGAAVVDFRPVAFLEWVTVAPGDLSESRNLPTLLDRIEEGYSSATSAASSASRYLATVDLSGPCPLTPQLRTPGEVAEVEDAIRTRLDVDHVELRTAGLRPFVSVQGFRGEASLAGEVVELIEQLRRDDQLLVDCAPEHLAAIPSGPSAEQVEYLRELLSDAEAEVLDRLVDSASN
jgi:hypothetical protein